MPLPPTKSCQLAADYEALREELGLLAPWLPLDPIRRWEQALALHAFGQWWDQAGGVEDRLWWDAGTLDNRFASAITEVTSFEGWAGLIERRSFSDAPVGVITARGVMEKCSQPLPCLRDLARHLQPGGLLFLTVDLWDAEGEDTAPGHETRKRIYNPRTWKDLWITLKTCGMTRFGAGDWTYHGHTRTGGYSIGSVCCIKRGGVEHE